MAKAAAMEHVAAAEAPAVKDVTTAPASAEMHAVTTAAAEMHAVTASAAVAAAHFSDQSLRDGFRGRRRAWTDRRQRVCGPARSGRQNEYRRRGEAQATHKSAPGIWNLGHS
jgi:hypothetical protein